MKYSKPQIIPVATATVAIQGGVKGGSVNPDLAKHPSIGAYEADE
jgi:hypothetical protein